MLLPAVCCRGLLSSRYQRNRHQRITQWNNWHSLIPRIYLRQIFYFFAKLIRILSRPKYKSVDPCWRSLLRHVMLLTLNTDRFAENKLWHLEKRRKKAEKFHSYQSFLWNMAEKRLIENLCPWKFFSFVRTWEFLKIIGSYFVGGEMTGYRCRYSFIHLDGERKNGIRFLI